jgi:Lar family restriction alleviation protein
MPSEELKPCPFCGGIAKLGHYEGGKYDTYYLVMCINCFSRTVGDSENEAVNTWNRRVIREQMPEIKPCKCGNHAESLRSSFGDECWVACSACGEEGESAKTAELAIAAWNKRITTDRRDM